MKIYKHPDQMIPLLEHIDIDGSDCINYFIEYEMFGILESRIMNLYIIEKWEGPVIVNCDLMDHSTSYCLLYHNKTGNLLGNDRLFTNMFHKIFTMDRS